ncbi:MAG: prenyltransferase/squalene oxidase repeat-containing protein [Phycisphaerales bacterium]
MTGIRHSMSVARALATSSFALAASFAVFGDPPAKAPSGPQAPPALAPPTTTLDPRVDATKITKQELPSLPREVVRPLPATHRIAARAADVPIGDESYAAARRAIDSGLAYLRKSQRPSGAWMEKEAVQPTDQPRASTAALAVTAMGAKAFMQVVPDDVQGRKALATVANAIRERGYDGAAEGGVGTYVASAVVSALAASGDRGLEDELRDGIAWLKKNQWDQSEGIAPDQDWFGGAGYGRSKRPDLSNTQMMLDAFHDAGVSPDDPAVQRALAFVERSQNVRSNDATWAKGGSSDGGFVYTPANGGESFASDKAGEGRSGEKLPAGQPRSLRSYGSMTYAGFKSLLYAGLSRDDERVKAAFDWICRHYTFDENPGLGPEGLFYYLHAMSRALLASQQQTIPSIGSDGATKDRNWREDLVAALVARQRPDGSWVNSADRWEESQPDLVTIYSLLALEEAIKPTLRTE